VTRIWLLAGEPSGDVLGARLIAALRAARPGIEVAGVGGPRMAEQGVASLFPMNDLALMGFVEVVPKLALLRRSMSEALADIAARRPDVVVTIDSPGFTLRLLKRLKGHGIPRVHYVAPQVWAWRESRVRAYPGLWERLLCLLPFEPAFFAHHGLPASFVGHPVLQSGADAGDAARFRARHGLAPDARVLVLMPGSRRSEVGRLLPVFAETLARLRQSHPALVPVLPAAAAVAEAVRAATSGWPISPLAVTGADEKHDAYAAAAAALTKSGTSTLELAMAGVPMAVTYRVNPLSAALARRLIRVPYAAMVNLLAGREVVPELLQENCQPGRLAEAVGALLDNADIAGAQRAAFREVVARLAPPQGTPAEAAAAAVLATLDG
jgi:lipid-A-disaccharide synthase